jgi:tetratricopeptide (TPR) repeat protein
VREATKLITQKNYDEALNKINESLVLDPNYSNAIKWKGQLYQAQGKWDEGLECFNKFLALYVKN